MTDEQQGDIKSVDPQQQLTGTETAQMNAGLNSLRSVLGTDSGIPESAQRSALWEYYFDVDSALAYLLEQKHKQEKQRQGEPSSPIDRPARRPPGLLAQVLLQHDIRLDRRVRSDRRLCCVALSGKARAGSGSGRRGGMIPSCLCHE